MSGTGDREPGGGNGGKRAEDSGELRSIAQLQMLHTLANQLNRLTDPADIGQAIAVELLKLIDYHNCRVYRLEPNGRTMTPIAFKGVDLEYAEETLEELLIEVGEGFTGHVAETRESYYSPNALYDPFAEQITGTTEIDESMLGVPLVFGDELVGVIILSKLGVDQFDDRDLRVLEVLAPHAAVAMVNADLLSEASTAASVSNALLKILRALTSVHDVEGVLAATIATIPRMMTCAGAQAYLRDPETGDFQVVAETADRRAPQAPGSVVPAALAERLLLSKDEPFILPKDMVSSVPENHRGMSGRQVLVAPLRWDPIRFAALVIPAPDEDATFTDADLELVRGIGDIASLALVNASQFEELEQSRDRLRTLDEMKTAFVEAVSHDLRTPLASILGIALTLTQSQVDLASEDSRDLLQRLAANARKLERLLADVLDLDRLMRGIVSPKRWPTDIAALVEKIAETEESLASRKVVLECEPVSISVDGPKVERIVENLLINAVRHTPDASTVWVRVAPEQGGVLLAVEDEGPGIPPEARESVFEAFHQGPATSRHSPGVGIGLSVVQRFAELHGGRAWVEERRGGGASFRVYLPDGPMLEESLSG